MIELRRVRPIGYEIQNDDGRSVLVQMDWDYPSMARTFGWDMRSVQVLNRGYYGLRPCDHDGTDGTIQCPSCGLTPQTFISAAAEYLDEHDGGIAHDPGYFDAD